MIFQHFWWWVEVHTGTVHEAGPYYGFWSGFGSDIAEFGIVAGLYANYKKHNCGARWCPRIGKHNWLDEHGLTHVLCRKHHPEHPGKAITAGHICHIHRKRVG